MDAGDSVFTVQGIAAPSCSTAKDMEERIQAVAGIPTHDSRQFAGQ